eukprot:UN13993
MRKQSFLGKPLLRTFSYTRTLLFILFEESKECANISSVPFSFSTAVIDP